MFLDPENVIEQFNLGEGMYVADLGVGKGEYTFAAARKVGDYGVVYGCDLQKGNLTSLEKEARRLGFENIHTIWTDLEEPGGTTLGNASMDAVIASNILFQIEHKEYFLQEVFRILKYGGKALIVDWNDSFGGIGPQSEAVVRRTVAHSLAEKAGFLFEKDVDAGSHHYGMIFRKPRQRS